MSWQVRALCAVLAGVTGFLMSVTPVRADPVDEVEDDIEAQFHDLEAIIEDYNKAKAELDETNEQIAELEKELKPFEDELAVLYDRVGDFASKAYMNGGLSTTTSVLTAGSPDAFMSRLTMLDTVSVSDNAAIQDLLAASADLADRKAVLDDLHEDQAARETQLAEQKETIETDLERLQEEREETYRDTRGGGEDGWIPPYVPGPRGEVVRFALQQVGEPYVWAASGPDGWDCSGLTLGGWSQVGVYLPHNAEAQWNQMTPISRDNLLPGDLVFYNGLSHVAMYIGDGHVVQAAINYYDVRIETIDSAAGSYYGAARVPGW